MKKIFTNLNIDNSQGYVMLIVLAITGAIVISGILMINNMGFTSKLSIEQKKYSQIRYAAEAAAAFAVNKAANLNEKGILPDFTNTYTIMGYNADVSMKMERDLLGNVKVTNTTGRFDMLSYTSYGKIEVNVVGNNGQKINIKQTIRFEEYPIFQFALFHEGSIYGNLGTGPDVIYNGRIHTNSVYKTHDVRKVFYQDWVTACCGFYYTNLEFSSNRRIYLFFTKLDGSMDTIPSPPTDLNAQKAWTELDKQNIKMRSRNNAVALDLFPGGEHPICLIKPADVNEYDQYIPGSDSPLLRKKKLVYRADLILEKKWSGSYPTQPSIRWLEYDSHGNRVTVTHNAALKNDDVLPEYDTTGQPAHTKRLFFDYSQMKWQTVTYINVDSLLLKLDTYYPNAKTIYLQGLWDTTKGISDVFILKNCSRLTRDLTFATNCPLYTWGNYNSETPIKNSALICDQLTILNGSWQTTYRDTTYHGNSNTTENLASRQGMRWYRLAKFPTTINACIMSGANRSENPAINNPHHPDYFSWYPRVGIDSLYMVDEYFLLENWQDDPKYSFYTTSRILAINGSTVKLWRSAYKNSHYFITDSLRYMVYRRADKKIQFDTKYNQIVNQPPSVPTVTAPFVVDHYEIR